MPLWAPSNAQNWLLRVAAAAAKEMTPVPKEKVTEESTEPTDKTAALDPIDRHILLSDIPKALELLPSRLATEGLQIYDTVPERPRPERELGFLEPMRLFLASLMPFMDQNAMLNPQFDDQQQQQQQQQADANPAAVQNLTDWLRGFVQRQQGNNGNQ